MQHWETNENCEIDNEAWYLLAAAQLGARATLRLLEAFQHPGAILSATPHAWVKEAQLSAKGCSRLLDAINHGYRQELKQLAQLGVQLISIYDPAYPQRLRTIPDPPSVLFVKGKLPLLTERAIAIVGSRRASAYGRHVAAELASGLAQRGFTIVSGLALGADAAAHEGCLRANGYTIAVLGCGVDVVYPPEHIELYERIAANGAVISEAPPGAPPTRTCFPIRNRIISGLSLGVVVVEASEKSGALITADHALEQNREVFAVPGSVNSAQSKGSHRLLRDGAKLVESVDDILEDLPVTSVPRKRSIRPLDGPQWNDLATNDIAPQSAPPIPVAKPAPRPKSPAQTPSLPPEEAAVLHLLSSTAKPVEGLIVEANLSPAQVNAALLMLELKGFVQRRPGNLYVRLQ